MSLLDQMGKKISQVSQDAVKGTKDLADIAKYNSLISAEERLIVNFCTSLGKQYYDLFSESPNEALKEVCDLIAESYAKTADYRQQILAIKGIRKCTACQVQLAEDAAFCGACGAKVEVIEPEVAVVPEPAVRMCAACNHPLPEDVGFCTECGQKFEEPQADTQEETQQQ